MTTTTIHDLRCLDCKNFEELPMMGGHCTAHFEGLSDSGVSYVLNVHPLKAHTASEYDDENQSTCVTDGCKMFEPTSAALKRARAEHRYHADPHKFNGVHPNKS